MILSTSMVVTLCIVTIILITCLTLLSFKNHKKNHNPFTTNRKSPSRRKKQLNEGKPLAKQVMSLAKQRQSCSYCKRKINPKELTFYAGPNQVIGVCRSCRPQAERQALLRV